MPVISRVVSMVLRVAEIFFAAVCTAVYLMSKKDVYKEKQLTVI